MHSFLKIMFVSLLFLLKLQSFGQQSDTLQTNRIINDTNAHADILFGYCSLEGLKNSITFKIHWDFEYANYVTDTKILDSIHGDLREITIKIVFASWCDDSRQQVPRFFKVLENTDIDLKKVVLVAVDKKKKAGEIQLESFNIQKVPTFIIYRNGIEIGRIIETPQISLEQDLLNILRN